jgi:hypothetical protein
MVTSRGDRNMAVIQNVIGALGFAAIFFGFAFAVALTP